MTAEESNRLGDSVKLTPGMPVEAFIQIVLFHQAAARSAYAFAPGEVSSFSSASPRR
jgi:hypothetical protein